MHRRDFISGTIATVAVARPHNVLARTSLGTATIETVSDGHLVLPGAFVFEPMPQDALSAVLDSFDLDRERLTPECNLALYRDGDRIVLFDVGSGPDFMPSAGKIVESLDGLGLTPADITHVVFTHAHPDHIWGLLDDFDEPLFAQATCLMGRKEWDYWWNPATVDEIDAARQAFAVGARRRMEAIEDSVVLFDDEDEVLPGIAAIASYGHTPGHMAFEIRNGASSALIVGDAIGNHHVAFARPDWPSGSDQDPQTAIAPRARLLDRLASEQMPVVGFHLPNGGMGRVERANSAYRFVPADA